MSDLIDRQAAIDAILHITNCKSVRELFEYNQLHHLTDMWSGGVNDAIDAVIGVDSAQLGTNLAEVGTDYISRQAVIDALHTWFRDGFEEDKWWNSTHVLAAIEGVSPAQPEPCEDAVSRKAVKDGFVEMCNLICPYTEKQRHAMCGSCLLGTAFDVLEATQSVTPKQRTGYWYPVGMAEVVGGESAQWGSAIAYHKCSECDEQALCEFGQEVLSKWCPNCGAKMVGVEE